MKVVDAAQEPVEYCFLWINHWSMCMTKSEWAGWMQSIGAILAILAAIVIASWETRHVRKVEARREADKVRALGSLCTSMVTMLEIGIAAHSERRAALAAHGDDTLQSRRAMESFEALRLSIAEGVRQLDVASASNPLIVVAITSTKHLFGQADRAVHSHENEREARILEAIKGLKTHATWIEGQAVKAETSY